MIKTTMVNNNQIVYDYRVHDQADLPYPLIFIHGMGADLHMWDLQLDYFSKNYTTLAMTLQGHGHSSALPKSETYSIEDYANTVVSLMDTLNIEKAIFIANSMGGVVSYHIKACYPKRVLMMATHGTTPALNHSKMMVKIILFMDKILLKLMGVDGMMKVLSKQVSKDPTARTIIYNTMKNANAAMISSTHKALSNYNYLSTFDLNDTPVIIIRGEYDKGITKSIAEHIKTLHTYSHCTLHDIAGAGHILNVEKPAEYNQIIDRAIKENFESR